MKSTQESKDETLDFLFESDVVEVDEEPDLDASQFHVGQQLGLVNPFDHFDAFQLDDQLILDQDVNSTTTEKSPFYGPHLRVLVPL